MSRGVLTTATAAVAVVLFVLALVIGVDQPETLESAQPSSEPTPTPAGSDPDGPQSEPTTDTQATPGAGAVDEPTPLPETPVEELLGRLSVITSFGGIPDEGGDIAFDISITNAGEVPVTFDDSHISLEGPSGPLEIVPDVEPAFGPTELEPDAAVSGTIVFRVPPASDGLSLVVAPPGVVPVEIRL